MGPIIKTEIVLPGDALPKLITRPAGLFAVPSQVVKGLLPFAFHFSDAILGGFNSLGYQLAGLATYFERHGG